MDLNNQQIQPCQLQTRSIEDVFPEDHLNQEATNELKKLLEIEKKINREELFYEACDTKKDRIYDFHQYKAQQFSWICYMKCNHYIRKCIQ